MYLIIIRFLCKHEIVYAKYAALSCRGGTPHFAADGGGHRGPAAAGRDSPAQYIY